MKPVLLKTTSNAIVDCNSDDIVYSNLFTGVHGNYLAPSIKAAGLTQPTCLFLIHLP
jgi:NAD(P)H-dependent flavin oxidoreductase YrpB (nitropropane dioxygenase family)